MKEPRLKRNLGAMAAMVGQWQMEVSPPVGGGFLVGVVQTLSAVAARPFLFKANASYVHLIRFVIEIYRERIAVL
jgi:hypothetical protein